MSGDDDHQQYLDDQSDEIEALQAIFMDEQFQILDVDTLETTTAQRLKLHNAADDAAAAAYRITVVPEEPDEEPPEIPQRLGLLFAYPPTYPDVPPLIVCQSEQGISKTDLANIETHLHDEALANVGMAMMFTLANAAKDWLREHANLDVGEMEDDAARKKKELAEEERLAKARRAAGIEVTKETFEDWHTRFEAERALAKALAPDAAERAERAKRMTGRAYFEKRRGEAVEAELEDDEEDFDLDDLDDEDDLLDDLEALVEDEGVSTLASS